MQRRVVIGLDVFRAEPIYAKVAQPLFVNIKKPIDLGRFRGREPIERERPRCRAKREQEMFKDILEPLFVWRVIAEVECAANERVVGLLRGVARLDKGDIGCRKSRTRAREHFGRDVVTIILRRREVMCVEIVEQRAIAAAQVIHAKVSRGRDEVEQNRETPHLLIAACPQDAVRHRAKGFDACFVLRLDAR